MSPGLTQPWDGPFFLSYLANALLPPSSLLLIFIPFPSEPGFILSSCSKSSLTETFPLDLFLPPTVHPHFQLPRGPGLVLVLTLHVSHLTHQKVCSIGRELRFVIRQIRVQIPTQPLSSFMYLASHFISLVLCFPHPLK